MKNRFSASVVSLVMTACLAACGTTIYQTESHLDTASGSDPGAVLESEEGAGSGSVDEQADESEPESISGTENGEQVTEEVSDQDAESSVIYEAQLGNFYDAYEEAEEETDLSTRYAKMAVAEALLLEDAVFLPATMENTVRIPTGDSAGMYLLRRWAPYSNASVSWGDDKYDYSDCIMTTELIRSEDYNALKEKWAKLRGTGTYQAEAGKYLQEKGYNLKDTMTLSYSKDPDTWDLFTSSLSETAQALCNTTDHLLSYDCENQLQPALADNYEVSEDGLTYTFHIKEGLKWVDSKGTELAELTAEDFAAGMQHFLEGGSGMEYLAGDSGACIKNADAYYRGECGFEEVGVKAEDAYTLVYTLDQPCPYFTTLLTCSAFDPLCCSYYEEQGENYGIDPDHIAYCGPYLVESAEADSSIVFQANPAYWNADSINVKKITWLYDADTDPEKSYQDCLTGTTDGCSLSASVLAIAKSDGNFDQYAVTSDSNGTAFVLFYNLNRKQYANYNDETKAVSSQTEEQKELTRAAMNNVHFRRAISCALDRSNYNAQLSSSDMGAMSLINSYTKGTFVALEQDITIAINGEDRTFPAGTWYGEIVQAKLDADGFPIKAFDKDADSGIGSGCGYDGWYNPDYAKSEMAIAVEELSAEGYEISAENPVQLDYPTWTGNTAYINKGNAYKQSLETVLEGKVCINLIACDDADTWYYTQYYSSDAASMNYDLGDQSGWMPDYGDPSTFLKTLLPEHRGRCTANLGLY